MAERLYTAIGLMSGTSLDGIDAALLRTDGEGVIKAGPWLSNPYQPALREALRELLGCTKPNHSSRAVEREMTDQHASIVTTLIKENDLSHRDIDVIGFHGHTVLHRPEEATTWQLGDGQRLADSVGCNVIADFRQADVAAGGEGAPFAPLFHRALATTLSKPLALLNVGGVGNVTWIDTDRVLAFDTGPGNALLDDWVARHGKGLYDESGAYAAAGTADQRALTRLLAGRYFSRPPPKSLDRLDFDLGEIEDLSFEDGAATLAAFTAGAVVLAQDHFPNMPLQWLVTGGGRHNAHLMGLLRRKLGAPVNAVEGVGWDGDALEAQAFAYLAVRSLLGLPLSLPGTTGVAAPTTGGKLYGART